MNWSALPSKQHSSDYLVSELIILKESVEQMFKYV